jgi:hypothetical protein
MILPKNKLQKSPRVWEKADGLSGSWRKRIQGQKRGPQGKICASPGRVQ